MTTKTRKKALIDGDHIYLGIPCKYGHEGLRYTNCCACVQCRADNRKPKVIAAVGLPDEEALSAKRLARVKLDGALEDKRLREELSYF